MIRKYLIQQYPREENGWKIIIPISLFIALFMIIFQPFGLNELVLKHKFLVLAGYGLVTLVILILDLLFIPALFRRYFLDDQWTVLKELIFLLWILFTVGLGNMIYSSWTMGFLLTISNILVFQVYTLAVGIIPIITLTMIKQNYLQRKNKESAERLSSALIHQNSADAKDQEIRIISENEKESVILNANELLFVKSDGNYITVGYLRNGKITRALLRNTMKYTIDLLAPFPFIFQCHRSWLINLNKISQVRGNSQGFHLLIEGFDEDIPVARNNSAEFRQRIAGNRG